MPTNATALSRSGTLSWQQRPSSRDSNSSRPHAFSPLPTETDPARTPEPSKPDQARDLSRKEIAESLRSKDPTWFRQTADRGTGSAALRREQGDSASDTVSATGRRQLPGMSRESTPEPEKSPLPIQSRGRSASPFNDGSSQTASRLGDRYSSISSNPTISDTTSPLSLSTAQRLLPSAVETLGPPPQQLSDSNSMQPPQSRPSSDRPPSPTKGLGGFVQSAMMKRSDSVNKRWSAQATAGLKRGDSIASNRSTLGNLATVPLTRGGSPPRETKPNTASQSSPSNHSRPNSSHSTSTVTQRPFSTYQQNMSGSTVSTLDKGVDTVAEKPTRPADSSRADGDISRSVTLKDELPVSPTKTMDPKRWSPTKASWLESALSKPESPKILSPKVEQPGWKADLQKSKQSRLDSDGASNPNLDVLPPSGLLRSPPPGGHTRPLSIGGLPEGFGSANVKKAAIVTPKPLTVQEKLEDTTTPQKSFTTDSVKAAETTDDHRKDGLKDVEQGSDTEPPRPTTSTSTTSSATPTAKREAPIVKPKPQTPPKTDFRANLKSRRQESQDSGSAEPEFRNVFGKLRRTETKNYVAPDELKTNILTGKAALNMTSGPQKSNKPDEFKESLVSQREAMKVGGGSIHKRSDSGKDIAAVSQKPEAPVPEALARRKTLSRATGASAVPPETRGPILPSPGPKPPFKAPIERLGLGKPSLVKATAAQSTDQTSNYPRSSEELPENTSRNIELPQATSGGLSVTLQSQSATVTPDVKHGSSILPAKSLPETVVPASDNATGVPRHRSRTTMAEKPQPLASDISVAAPRSHAKETGSSGKLAGRLNPNLASILMRGPASGPSSRNQSTEDLSSMSHNTTSTSIGHSQEPADGHLSHMTKGRAKGPKRRLPKSGNNDETILARASTAPEVGAVDAQVTEQLSRSTTRPSSPSVKTASKPLAARPLATLLNQNEKIKPVMSETFPKIDMKIAEPDAAKAIDKSKPAVAAKSPELRRVSSPKPNSPKQEATLISGSAGSHQASPLAPRTKNFSKDESQPRNTPSLTPHVDDVKAGRTKLDTSSTPAPQSLQRPKEHAKESARMNGLGLSLDAPPSQRFGGPRPEPTPPEDKSFVPRVAAASLPQDVKSPRPFAQLASTVEPLSKSAQRSPTKDRGGNLGNSPQQATTTSIPPSAEILKKFFGEVPKARDKTDVDAHAVLSATPDMGEKTKTLRAQIWEVNGDGKRQEMPPQQEHILFEECMYLCIHFLETAKGTKSAEAFLWCGDGIGEAAIEDAQLFCRKVARENSAKLEVLKQGKEVASFIQALGGIIITRRAKSSSLYMLCGRRHLGHVCFDEVDLDTTSLCSGFPYLISAKFGKLYLWKGKGSGADELGCARLIGMDLGLTGEIEEVNEDEEPANFWEAFSGDASSKLKLSDHWASKGQHDQYFCRLFQIELDRPKPATSFWSRRGSSPGKTGKNALVQEVTPFCQRDLEASNIYIL